MSVRWNSRERGFVKMVLEPYKPYNIQLFEDITNRIAVDKGDI